MAKLINGNGNPAIYAAEDADLIASLAGNVTCIANVGNKYAATEEDATTIRLDDGVIITKEGRRIQLEAGESDTFYIPTGTSGQTNYYIIGYKLVQNADSTQVAEQFVQKMNSSSETITEDTFRSGATEVYVSVYRVTQVGFTIDSISGLLPELLDNASIKDNIDQINSDLTLKADKSTVNALPVKPNDSHFYNANGLNVVNANADAYTDLHCKNVLASGGYVKSGTTGIAVTNNAGNTWLSISASDLKINGTKSVSDSLPKTHNFSNISINEHGVGYLDYNIVRPSTHVLNTVFGTVASTNEICRFEILADMTNNIYAIQPWTYQDIKVTSTTANVTIGYVKK